MPAPAVNITTETSPPPRSSPTDTGPVFLAGIAERGPAATSTVPSLVEADDAFETFAQWQAVYGGRIAGSVDYDWVETYFRNGGNLLRYARTLGDTPVKASISLAGSSGATLVVTAPFYGSKYNEYKIQVTNGDSGSSRILKLCNNAGTVLDVTAQQTAQAGFLGLTLQDPDYDGDFVISVGGGTASLPTVAAATVLASGTDDAATIDSVNVARALDQFQPDLGPGQVAVPNWGGDANVHGVALSHAGLCTPLRYAKLDTSNVTSTGKATLITEGTDLQGGTYGSHGALYGPWITVAALAPGGAARSVPASALVCARTADTDARFHPNRAAAGTKDGVGIAKWAEGVNATFSRTPAGASDADALSEAGVNLIVAKNGQIVIYDDVSLVDQDGAEANYLHVPNGRYRMWTVARAQVIGEGEQFDQVNANTIAEFQNALQGTLLEDFGRGILVPDLDDPRPATAFNVDTTTPNTRETMQAGELNANLAVRPARSARIINITITAVALTEPVA